LGLFRPRRCWGQSGSGVGRGIGTWLLRNEPTDVPCPRLSRTVAACPALRTGRSHFLSSLQNEPSPRLSPPDVTCPQPSSADRGCRRLSLFVLFGSPHSLFPLYADLGREAKPAGCQRRFESSTARRHVFASVASVSVGTTPIGDTTRVAEGSPVGARSPTVPPGRTAGLLALATTSRPCRFRETFGQPGATVERLPQRGRSASGSTISPARTAIAWPAPRRRSATPTPSRARRSPERLGGCRR